MRSVKVKNIADQAIEVAEYYLSEKWKEDGLKNFSIGNVLVIRKQLINTFHSIYNHPKWYELVKKRQETLSTKKE